MEQAVRTVVILTEEETHCCDKCQMREGSQCVADLMPLEFDETVGMYKRSVTCLSGADLAEIVSLADAFLDAQEEYDTHGLRGESKSTLLTRLTAAKNAYRAKRYKVRI